MLVIELLLKGFSYVRKIKKANNSKQQEIVERTKDGPQHLQDASGWLLFFMNAGLKTIPEQMKGLDAFNRFGLTLFFAGAGDFVGTRYRCDQKQRSDMLTERMQLLSLAESILPIPESWRNLHPPMIVLLFILRQLRI